MTKTPVTRRSDTLTLTYRMADIMHDTRLLRPVPCYFYLHRNLGKGRSTVIAQTPPKMFRECPIKCSPLPTDLESSERVVFGRVLGRGRRGIIPVHRFII